MANARKDSPDRIKRMRELAASGASARQIGEALGVDHKTVIRWLKARPGAEPAKVSKRAPDLPAPPAVPMADLLTEVDAEAPLEVIRRRRHQIRAALDANFDATTTGAFPMAIFERLAKLETYYLAEEARHTPPEPPDPEKDPNNLEAARRLAAMLGALVEQAEADTRCAHCGKRPFDE